MQNSLPQCYLISNRYTTFELACLRKVLNNTYRADVLDILQQNRFYRDYVLLWSPSRVSFYLCESGLKWDSRQCAFPQDCILRCAIFSHLHRQHLFYHLHHHFHQVISSTTIIALVQARQVQNERQRHRGIKCTGFTCNSGIVQVSSSYPARACWLKSGLFANVQRANVTNKQLAARTRSKYWAAQWQMQAEARQGGRQRSRSLLGQTLNHKAKLVSQRKRFFYEQYNVRT